MKRNVSILTRELARLKRLEKAGHTLYSPVFIDDRPVAMAKFMPEGTIPTPMLEMALIEKAENASLPLFLIRHDDGLTRFQVTPGNILACSYLSTPKTLSEDGLVELLEYCANR